MALADSETIAVEQNLAILTGQELAAIQQVVERDAALKDQHEQNLRRIKNEILELQRARDAEMDFGLNRNACALCMATFGRFFNRGAICPWCTRKVCSTCRLCTYSLKKRWMCSLCAKEWQLRRMTGDWMATQTSDRRRLSVSMFILKSLLAMKHSTHQFLELPSRAKPHSASQQDVSGTSVRVSNQMLGHGCSVDAGSGFGSINGSIGKVASNPSISSRIVDSVHQGILHVQSDAMLYLHSTLGIPAQKVRTLSEESTVKRQLDFANPNGIGPAGSFDIYHDHSSGQFTVDGANVIASTPLSPTAPMVPPAAKNLDFTISSVGTVMEDHHVTHLPSDSQGDIQLKVSLKCESGAIEVSVLRCRNLPAVPHKKKVATPPSPYVKLYLQGTHGGYSKRKTAVMAHTFNPVFEEVLQFAAVKEKVAGWSLRVVVCHKERVFRSALTSGLQRTVVLGQTTMLITENLLFMEHPLWIRLHKPSEPSLLSIFSRHADA